MRLDLESSSNAIPLTQDADHPTTADEARESLEQGIKAAQAGDRAGARGLLLRAAELEPRNETTWLWLASISEYPEELLVFLGNVLDINPKNERALEWTAATRSLLAKTFVQRGIDAFEENRSDLAADCFNKALEYDQQNSMAWLWMASLSDSDEGKITYLEKVLDIDPDNKDARTALEAAKRNFNEKLLEQAKSAAISGSKAEAIEFVDAIIAESPECIEAWLLRCHLVDDFEEKIRCYDQILVIDPKNAAAASGRESLNAIFGTLPTKEPAPNGTAGSIFSDTVVYVEDAPIDKSPTQDLELPKGFPPPSSGFQTEGNFKDDEFKRAEYHLNKSGESGVAFSDGDVQDEMVDCTAPDLPPSYEDAPETASTFDNVTDPFSNDQGFATDEPGSQIKPVPTIEDTSIFVQPSAEAFPVLAPSTEFDPFASPDEGVAVPAAAFPDFQQTLTGFETVLVHSPNGNQLSSPSACPYCGTPNDSQTIVCHSCLAVLTLSDLEMLLGNQHADKFVLRDTVARMESERVTRELTEQELITLAIGHLNLRNFQFGFAYLQEASKLNPNNVVLAGQVHALLIRLEDIRRQEEAAERMPKGKTILVVDDSPTVRKLIAGKLEKCGHEVFCSSDGVEAMERLETLVPDLVLLDITMPRMDGYQVCKLIRSNPATKDIPVVMISGKDGFFDKVRGRMAGTTGYITKPFGPETLMKAVEVYLKGETPELV